MQYFYGRFWVCLLLASDPPEANLKNNTLAERGLTCGSTRRGFRLDSIPLCNCIEPWISMIERKEKGVLLIFPLKKNQECSDFP